jgi:murein DD-endopeptidase MepM/ murein hydrolase activator NlpD
MANHRPHWLAGFGAGLLALAASAAEPAPCGEGLALRVSSPTPVQGSLVLVKVESAAPLAELKAVWAGQELHFWREANPPVYRALLGVDLERAPGAAPLTLEATLEGGARRSCRLLATVEDGKFALERLTLPRRFVELSPADLERSQREAARLREIFAGVTPERLWQGGFRLPLEAEAAGNFGRRRILNDQPRAPHSGEDFSAPAGTPVTAAQRGRVALADEFFFSGKTVVLDHGLGLFTFYAHLQSVVVEPGQVVEAGALLGRVGATGRVTAAHLHWAARLNQARVNPRDLVALLPE